MTNSNVARIDLMNRLKDEDPIRHRILELAELENIAYDQIRQKEAESLGIRVGTLDEEVSRARLTQTDDYSDDDELTNGISPWPGEVRGQEIYDDIKRLLTRYVSIVPECYIAIALWVIGTYVYDAFRIFPKLFLESPEKRCGKTTLMEVLAAIVHRALMASNVTPATIFRAVNQWRPTLLIDEADALLTRENEELRGLINSGHTRTGANVLRVEEVGGERVVVKLSTWAPMGLAGINSPPDTIKDRSITIPLRRKLSTEKLDRLPLDLFEQYQALRQKLQRWAEDNFDELRRSDPLIPEIDNDRAQDNWIPLLSIAELIDPQLANEARLAMQLLETIAPQDSAGVGPLLLPLIFI